MSRNAFARLVALRPDAPLLLGRVVRHNADDTSDIELPIDVAAVGVGSVTRGSLIRARGTHVPVDSWAFVRRGIVETEAPIGTPRTYEVGGPP
jgi:hypothetical protein